MQSLSALARRRAWRARMPKSGRPKLCSSSMAVACRIGMATGTETTMKVHARLALENGATVDDICEVIRIIFFTCGVTKLLPILEKLDLETIDLDEA